MFKGSFILVLTFALSVFAVAVSLLSAYSIKLYRPAERVTTVVHDVREVPVVVSATPSAAVKATQLPVRILTPVATEVVPKS